MKGQRLMLRMRSWIVITRPGKIDSLPAARQKGPPGQINSGPDRGRGSWSVGPPVPVESMQIEGKLFPR